MRRFVWSDLDEAERQYVLRRPVFGQTKTDLVKAITEKVQKEGDEALQYYSEKFDGCRLSRFLVSDEEFEEADALIDPELEVAMDMAIRNIEFFHRPQKRISYSMEIDKGLNLSLKALPLSRIGLYIPSGTAPLVSTLLMLAVPARIAGCEDIVVCIPPDRTGSVHPALLVAAKRLGIRRVYKVGGAQAIAAMAYGTRQIPKVDKILGPGNAWVTEAKRLVSQDPLGAQIDMPAGPSELMVVADLSSYPRFVASDLLSQAEHGIDSQVILLSLQSCVIDDVEKEMQNLLLELPRADYIRKSLEKSASILVDDMSTALTIMDDYAPEHLSLQVERPDRYLPYIRKAGSVFVGAWTPEAAGDYASGSNHVLPTSGFARSLSGLSVGSFQRTMSVQTMSREALLRLSPTLQILAKTEGLSAHGRAVEVRLEELRREGQAYA